MLTGHYITAAAQYHGQMSASTRALLAQFANNSSYSTYVLDQPAGMFLYLAKCRTQYIHNTPIDEGAATVNRIGERAPMMNAAERTRPHVQPGTSAAPAELATNMLYRYHAVKAMPALSWPPFMYGGFAITLLSCCWWLTHH